MIVSSSPPLACAALHPCVAASAFPRHERKMRFFQRPALSLAANRNDEKNSLLRCLALFPFESLCRVCWGAARFLAHAPPVSLVVDVCVCQFPFHMNGLSSKARVSLPHRYGARRSCFPGRVAVRSTRGRGEVAGHQVALRPHPEGLGRPLELVRRALVIRFPFLCMSQSIHPT